MVRVPPKKPLGQCRLESVPDRLVWIRVPLMFAYVGGSFQNSSNPSRKKGVYKKGFWRYVILNAFVRNNSFSRETSRTFTGPPK
jgi:hypothetical protein